MSKLRQIADDKVPLATMNVNKTIYTSKFKKNFTVYSDENQRDFDTHFYRNYELVIYPYFH